MIKLNNIKDNTKYYDCSIYNQDEEINFICFSSDNIGVFNYNHFYQNIANEDNIYSDSDNALEFSNCSNKSKEEEYYLNNIETYIDKVRWIKNVNDNIEFLCFVPDICIRNIKDIEK
jgi:hypothetical protein